MKWYEKVKVGDILHPHPHWNKTENKHNQMPSNVEILEVKKAQSQSGTLFTVRTNNGEKRSLDAAWFMEP